MNPTWHDMRVAALAKFEEETVKAMLAACEGNVSKVSRDYAIERVYLHRLMRRYGIKSNAYRVTTIPKAEVA